MAKVASASLPGWSPSIAGGSLRWNKGSAAPQKRMPVAIVVQSVTANQRQRERMGVASGPPMIRPPSGESAMPASSARKPIPAQAKSGEKLRRIQSLIAVSAATTEIGRASCGERVWQGVESAEGEVTGKKERSREKRRHKQRD